MKCPFCDDVEDKVVDSRMAKEGEVIRRRRECLSCKRRYTTYERVEETMPAVVKKDGRREPFDRSKIVSGLKKACEKRPISTATIEAVTDRIEKRIQDMGETEIESTAVGEEVMKELSQLDQVAYVRFASVYREFKDIDQFMDEIKSLAQQRRER
ncbi:MAG: transcriptional regulator NrdR [Nitrospira sp.]|uniref:Transcriptional repressor NrdR n=1 Tax=Nitrospira defluvii TaxID=330214 RepID=A0ABM8QQ28_9BACT|nr:transcriptional regulator NrdR [Nitrospira defluvii]MBX3346056.1 transcriptional regulator NrdR [Nitrospira sp.]MCS6329386.1 transcriptional repressor NrdR [Nitrospira sp.]MCW5786806.1 transcriptional regulator NrdR [Nitrospira sp.]MCW5797192.1 transcriptional regulator NrdR [Nitrospira sp.]MDR4474784.1 transcriptional regulator NrdR [Nitrospira sp.]